MDSGFLDNKIFTYFEENLRIHYVCSGKLYKDIKNYAKKVDPKLYSDYEKGKILWKFLEFGNKLKNWTKMRRCIYTTMSTDDKGQMVLDFMGPDNIIYTNLGNDDVLIDVDTVSIVSYPNTIRRIFIDFAVKITDHSGYHIMKVTQAVFDSLKIAKIWELCSEPPKIRLL